IVTLDDDFQEADLAALAGGVQSALERRCPFAVAIVGPRRLVDPGSDDAPPLRWLRRRRAEVGTWCRGVAYVVSDVLDPLAHAEAVRARERLWGCPVAISASFDDAIAWLDERLRACPGAHASEGER
ncbi:MAG: hypothetical protein ACRDL3_09790, partial [Solirubrobacterales bacterium]